MDKIRVDVHSGSADAVKMEGPKKVGRNGAVCCNGTRRMIVGERPARRHCLILGRTADARLYIWIPDRPSSRGLRSACPNAGPGTGRARPVVIKQGPRKLPGRDDSADRKSRPDFLLTSPFNRGTVDAFDQWLGTALSNPMMRRKPRRFLERGPVRIATIRDDPPALGRDPTMDRDYLRGLPLT